MAHIQVPEGAPGILGPMAISPESTKALRELVEVLLRGPNTLTPAEREMIATLSLRRKMMFTASVTGRVRGWAGEPAILPSPAGKVALFSH
jgi:hypothetical protein